MIQHRQQSVDAPGGAFGTRAEPVATNASASVALHPASGARFTATETQVIALARGDGIASLDAPGRLARLAATLFGIEPERRPLADPRLETLRRAVVVTRARRHMPDPIAATLADAGYWPAQVRVIEALALAG